MKPLRYGSCKRHPDTIFVQILLHIRSHPSIWQDSKDCHRIWWAGYGSRKVQRHTTEQKLITTNLGTMFAQRFEVEQLSDGNTEQCKEVLMEH